MSHTEAMCKYTQIHMYVCDTYRDYISYGVLDILITKRNNEIRIHTYKATSKLAISGTAD